MSTTTASTDEVNVLEAITFAHGTDVGKKREENQDSLGVIENADLRFFVVADGMGGVKGGAIASSLAVSAVKEVISAKNDLSSETICEAIGEANARIYEKGIEDPSLTGMGTTFVGIGFRGAAMFIASVGDSRAYRIRGGRIEQLTEDHTLVMELLRSGAISPEQAGNHPVSHMLTRSLGPAPAVEVDCWKCPDGPAAGDMYLMCSDGLYNLVGAEEMLERLQESTIDDAVQDLIDLANLRGGTDNITVMVVAVDESFSIKADQYAPVLDDMPEHDGGVDAEEEESSEVEQDDGLFDPGSLDGEIPAEKLASAQGQNGSVAHHNEASSQQPQEGAEAAHAEPQQEKEAPAAAAAQRSRKISQISISLAVLIVGFLGGILASRGPSRPPLIAGKITNEVTAPEPQHAEVAKVAANTARTESTAAVAPQLEQPPVSVVANNIVPAPGPENSAISAEGKLSEEETARISKRREVLETTLAELSQRIESFSKPFSGRAGELLSDAARQSDELKGQIDQVRADIDVATRKLSVWYGRRKRLQSSDPINLSTEVAVTSSTVRERKEAFERATWAYLKEAEVQRYHPNDKEQDKKVADLMSTRKESMRELTEEVGRAIEHEISDADRRISELTLKRDTLEGELEKLRRDVEYVKVLTSGDESARTNKRKELEREKEIAVSELEELNRVMPHTDSSRAATTDQQ